MFVNFTKIFFFLGSFDYGHISKVVILLSCTFKGSKLPGNTLILNLQAHYPIACENIFPKLYQAQVNWTWFGPPNHPLNDHEPFWQLLFYLFKPSLLFSKTFVLVLKQSNFIVTHIDIFSMVQMYSIYAKFDPSNLTLNTKDFWRVPIHIGSYRNSSPWQPKHSDFVLSACFILLGSHYVSHWCLN